MRFAYTAAMCELEVKQFTICRRLISQIDFDESLVATWSRKGKRNGIILKSSLIQKGISLIQVSTQPSFRKLTINPRNFNCSFATLLNTSSPFGKRGSIVQLNITTSKRTSRKLFQSKSIQEEIGEKNQRTDGWMELWQTHQNGLFCVVHVSSFSARKRVIALAARAKNTSEISVASIETWKHFIRLDVMRWNLFSISSCPSFWQTWVRRAIVNRNQTARRKTQVKMLCNAPKNQNYVS